jgi:hypothetical protein
MPALFSFNACSTHPRMCDSIIVCARLQSRTSAEGAKVSFDLVADRRSGKSSADNLRVG